MLSFLTLFREKNSTVSFHLIEIHDLLHFSSFSTVLLDTLLRKLSSNLVRRILHL